MEIITFLIGFTLYGQVFDDSNSLTGVRVESDIEVVYTDFNGIFSIPMKDSLQITYSMVSYKDTTILYIK